MYIGGKNGEGVYQTIINCIPPHKIFIEPFLGSGAIMRKIKPAKRIIGIDINEDTLKQFEKLYPGNAEIINACGISYLNELSYNTILDRKDVFIYADPPYPVDSIRSKKPLYEFTFTDQQHTQLLNILCKLPCKIAISTYPNELYKSLLHNWSFIDFEAKTHKGMMTERLYMNYKLPDKLHDYSFLGSNFTDRQRIKRKIRTHVLGLLKLPHLERSAIIEAITAGID